MKTFTTEELTATLAAHKKWLRGEAGGIRAYLSGANLSDTDLSDTDLRRANLIDTDLRRAYLSGANLSGADLIDTDLRRANLSGANLSGANLRGAEIPIVPGLHRRILAAIEQGGTLEMNAWHTCETTHCRAGWAVVLAGKPGELLEGKYGTSAAAALISLASCPFMERVPDFHTNNHSALADIRKCAALEAEAAEA